MRTKCVAMRDLRMILCLSVPAIDLPHVGMRNGQNCKRRVEIRNLVAGASHLHLEMPTALQQLARIGVSRASTSELVADEIRAVSADNEGADPDQLHSQMNVLSTVRVPAGMLV